MQMSWKWWPGGGLVALVLVVNLTAAGTEPRLVDAVKAGDRETVRSCSNGRSGQHARRGRHATPPLGCPRGRSRDGSIALQ